MQLALQEFAVEVKAVPVGLDVLPVAKSFKPDIVFADVLLTKRNGYEVCADLKNDSETQHLPVVLMWSGFMEIDEAKIALATAKLEKPFDADTLRQLVQELVPKTQNNPISPYLQFPKMPEFTESPNHQPEGQDPTPPAPAVRAAPPKPAATIPTAAPIDFDKFDPNAEKDEGLYSIPEDKTVVGFAGMMDPEEEFTSVPLKSSQQRDQHEEDGWTQQDLKKFKIQLPEEKPEDDFASKFVIPQEELRNAHVQDDGEFEELYFGEDMTSTRVAPLPESYKEDLKRLQTYPSPEEEAPIPRILPKVNSATLASSVAMKESPTLPDSDMMERMIREEARYVIEGICWKVLPEIAERIIREEINKILRDVEKSV
jgi:two-component system cell cycle response regulator